MALTLLDGTDAAFDFTTGSGGANSWKCVCSRGAGRFRSGPADFFVLQQGVHSMSFADAFGLPVVVELPDGRKVALYPLAIRDLRPWLSELTKARQDEDRAAIPPAVKLVDR